MKPWEMLTRTSVHKEQCQFNTTFRLQYFKTSFKKINKALLIPFCSDLNRNFVCHTLSKVFDLSKNDTTRFIILIYKYLK